MKITTIRSYVFAIFLAHIEAQQLDFSRLPCPKNSADELCSTSCPSTCYKRRKNQRCSLMCSRGCKCKNGYVWHKGECIPRHQCPPEELLGPISCTDKEFYTQNLPVCQQTCETLRNPIHCEFQTIEGCQCKEGYVRHNQDCITINECQNILYSARLPCPKNSAGELCSTSCPSTCYKRRKNQRCSLKCGIGCKCKNGYVWHKGECIPRHQCPPEELLGPISCTDKEFFTQNLSVCQQTCETLHNPIHCEFQTIEGCQCKEGYVRHNQDCITLNECGNILSHRNSPCPKNSIEDECPNHCPPTCYDRGEASVCNKKCGSGCVCKAGYVWYKGECIPLHQCPPKENLGPNSCTEKEIYTEDLLVCEQRCENLYNPVECEFTSVEGCECKEGYVRHKQDCITKAECRSILFQLGLSCPRNSIGKECTVSCPTTCYNKDAPESCRNCGIGCQCNKGYVWYKGECIPQHQCPPKAFLGPNSCSANEFYTEEMSVCELTCENLHNPSYCEFRQVEGCQCKYGYVRHNRSCITLAHCQNLLRLNKDNNIRSQ